MLSLPPEIDRLLPTDQGKIALETLRDCYTDLEALAGDKSDIDALTAVKDALVALAAINDELQNLATDPASFPGDLKVADKLMINETANTKQTKGLTAKMATGADEILTLKHSEVAHGMTARTETDSFFTVNPVSETTGGASLRGWSEDKLGLWLSGAITTDDTDKSASAKAAVEIRALNKSTTSYGSMGSNANLLSITNHTATKFLFDAEGEMHSDAIIGAGNDWDDWDDLALAADISRMPNAKWDETLKYHAEDFERAGLITLSTDEDGTQHAFVKHKAMLLFYACCFRDVLDRFAQYDQLLLDNGILPAK